MLSALRVGRAQSNVRGKSVSLLALLVGFCFAFVSTTAFPALADNDRADGSLTGGQTYYSTVRYHATAPAMSYILYSYTSQCGGGAFGLRPLRQNGNWMAGWLDWATGAGSHTLNSRQTWGNPGTISSGYFTLSAINTNADGDPHHDCTLSFQGNVHF